MVGVPGSIPGAPTNLDHRLRHRFVSGSRAISRRLEAVFVGMHCRPVVELDPQRAPGAVQGAPAQPEQLPGRAAAMKAA